MVASSLIAVCLLLAQDAQPPAEAEPSAPAVVSDEVSPQADAPPEPDAGALTLKRPEPNYDGRSPEWQASKARLIPRVLVFPVYAINEYLLRAPLGVLLRWVERDHVGPKVYNALTFRDHTIGIFPAFKLTNGMKTTVGFLAFAKHPFASFHDVTLTTQTSFTRIVETVLTNRFTLSPTTHLDLVTAYSQRDDYLFYGIGPLTHKDDKTRFERRKPFALLEIANGASARPPSRVGDTLGANSPDIGSNQDTRGFQKVFGGRLSVELSDNTFRCGGQNPNICGPDHVTATADDRSTFGQNGQAAFFNSGYSLLRVKGQASFDSRDPANPSQTGVRFDAIGRYGKGLGGRGDNISFFRYGGELSGFLDVSGGLKRVLAARLHVEMEDNTQKNGTIPFEELVSLGGYEALRGFLPSRFLGPSAVVASIEYRYPIWSFLLADIFYDLGNTFSDNHLKDFKFSSLRGSYGLSFRSNSSRDLSFQFLIAVGTERDSVKPDEFRIAGGANAGF